MISRSPQQRHFSTPLRSTSLPFSGSSIRPGYPNPKDTQRRDYITGYLWYTTSVSHIGITSQFDNDHLAPDIVISHLLPRFPKLRRGSSVAQDGHPFDRPLILALKWSISSLQLGRRCPPATCGYPRRSVPPGAHSWCVFDALGALIRLAVDKAALFAPAAHPWCSSMFSTLFQSPGYRANGTCVIFRSLHYRSNTS